MARRGGATVVDEGAPNAPREFRSPLSFAIKTTVKVIVERRASASRVIEAAAPRSNPKHDFSAPGNEDPLFTRTVWSRDSRCIVGRHDGLRPDAFPARSRGPSLEVPRRRGEERGRVNPKRSVGRGIEKASRGRRANLWRSIPHFPRSPRASSIRCRLSSHVYERGRGNYGLPGRQQYRSE